MQSNNISLVRFYCHNNKLSRINVTANTALEKFNISNNLLSALNIRNNTALWFLNINNNAELSMIDVKANTALKELHCNGLTIGELNIANNTALTRLECHSNPNLTTLTCSNAFDFTTTHISINKGLKILNTSGSVLTPSVGDLITVNLCKGVVFSASNGSFKVVSVTEENSLDWGSTDTQTSATDQNNGANNMAKIKALSDWETKYPAFKWCSDYGSDWYLPARNELKTIYNNKSTINSTLSANGGTTLGTGYYWSSTEHSKVNAIRIDFSEDYTGYWNKDASYKVRAVLAF